MSTSSRQVESEAGEHGDERSARPTRRSVLAASSASAVAASLASGFLTRAYALGRVNLGSRSNLNFLMQRATRGYNRNEMAMLLAVQATTDQYRDLLLYVAPSNPDARAAQFLQPWQPLLDRPPCQYDPATCGPAPGPSPDEGVIALRAATVGRSVTTVNLLYDRTVGRTTSISIWIASFASSSSPGTTKPSSAPMPSGSSRRCWRRAPAAGPCSSISTTT
jgi:hypothetical protein